MGSETFIIDHAFFNLTRVFKLTHPMPLFLTYMMTAVVSSFYIDAFSYVWLQRVVLPEKALNTATRPPNSDALLG